MRPEEVREEPMGGQLFKLGRDSKEHHGSRQRHFHRPGPIYEFCIAVPHLDVFWYHLKVWAPKKCAQKSSCNTFSIYISHKN